MAEITDDALNDRNHWRVDLRGQVNGEERTVSYHLPATHQALARKNALVACAPEFDELPWIINVERYGGWRLWEKSAEGKCGQ